MKSIVMVALLLIGFDADADMITIKKEVAARLGKAGLLTNGDGMKCQYWDLPTKVVIGCYGPERARYYREAMQVLADLNPVDKYNALLNSGHVEVR